MKSIIAKVMDKFMDHYYLRVNTREAIKTMFILFDECHISHDDVKVVNDAATGRNVYVVISVKSEKQERRIRNRFRLDYRNANEFGSKRNKVYDLSMERVF